MRILIIDDDLEGTAYVSTFLRLEGFIVHTATYGDEGLKLLQQLAPDLVILDILLPDINGHNLCRQIRSITAVLILIFSGYAVDVKDQIRGLDCGADDYLTKPVDFDLLKAHITALLRRSTQVGGCPNPQNYSDDYLTVDIDNQQVRINGQHISLSGLDYQLLELLVCNADQTVPALEIVESLWPGKVHECEDTGLRTYIKRLREKIEPTPRNPIYIVNEYGLGYRFVSQTLHKPFTMFL